MKHIQGLVNEDALSMAHVRSFVDFLVAFRRLFHSLTRCRVGVSWLPASHTHKLEHTHTQTHERACARKQVLFEWQKLQKGDSDVARSVEKLIIELQRKFRDGVLLRSYAGGR